MLTPTEAARLILQHVAPLPAERRPLKEALDLVLAEDVTSPIDLPGWDNSAMDGYAVRAADVAGATRERRKTLRIVETVPAGRFPEQPLVPGAATRIFTGAPPPPATTSAAGAKTCAAGTLCSRQGPRSGRPSSACWRRSPTGRPSCTARRG